MEALGEFLGQVLFYVVLFTIKAAIAAVRLAARGTAALLPPAPSAGAAAGYALLTAGGWTLLLAVVIAIVAGGDSFPVGLVIGGTVGCFVGVAVYQRGTLEAAAQSGAVHLGAQRGFLGVAQPKIVSRATRVRHVAIFGPTGSGKSTVLKNLMLQDAAAPNKPGLLCLDIKDDLVTNLCELLPAVRLGDVLLFDPADTAFPPAFNPLADVPAEQRTLAAGELVSSFHRLFAEAWGPRLEHVLRAVILTLLEVPAATLLDISRLLTNADYRSWALSHVTNFSVRDFWEREYPSIIGKGGSLANVQSILNKLGIFAYPEVRNVLGQTTRGLDIAAAMHAGKLVLVNLPQGVLGEDAAFFLASLLMGRVQVASQRRVSLAPEHRRTFYVFCDEFQNYTTSSFDKLITEGRSMGVGLVTACQFREQLPAELRLALEKNCAYGLFCRRSQGKHVIDVVNWQEPDAPDAVSLLRALPPPVRGTHGQLTAIRDQSRRQLAQPRTVVEQAIAARMSPQTTVIGPENIQTASNGRTPIPSPMLDYQPAPPRKRVKLE
jgi:energy-coupling factor transporter ATP-binding protein EcfA2